LKSVELLVALALLLGVYASLYREAAACRDAAGAALGRFNESLRRRAASSLVRSLRAYGEPFSYGGFGRFDPAGAEGLEYDPVRGRYTYRTYSRW
jgi:hypothetical protein